MCPHATNEAYNFKGSEKMLNGMEGHHESTHAITRRMLTYIWSWLNECLVATNITYTLELNEHKQLQSRRIN